MTTMRTLIEGLVLLGKGNTKKSLVSGVLLRLATDLARKWKLPSVALDFSKTLNLAGYDASSNQWDVQFSTDIVDGRWAEISFTINDDRIELLAQLLDDTGKTYSEQGKKHEKRNARGKVIIGRVVDEVKGVLDRTEDSDLFAMKLSDFSVR